MPGVYHCSPYNSTHFTTCCNVAIVHEQALCPKCKQPVYPETDAELTYYTPHERHIMRHNQAMRKTR